MSSGAAHEGAPPGASGRRARRLALAAGLLAYLAIATAMLWHVLTLSVTRATTCACSDSSLFAWFFEWPLVALSHAHNPFYSSAMFHPMGINLLSNTSVTAWSFLLLPVTAVFGPFASLNVALVVAPALSGLSLMWVAMRWVRSPLAAFVAGALYAFSPLVLFQEAGAHLMVTSLAVPPLVLACLDELFWRRRRTPWKVGVALAGLLVVQFFSGTEVLTMLAVATALSLVVLGLGALVADRPAAVAAIRAGAPGLAVGVGLALVVLAWPAYYALEGPGHYVGAVWPGIAPAQASLRSYLVAVPGTRLWWAPDAGRFMRPTYLGPPLVVTMLAGVAASRRRGRVLAAVAMTAVVAWLALGQRYAIAPWHYLVHLPLLRDVMNERFSALLLLPAGLALALVLDELRERWRGALGLVLATAVGVACLLPFALDASDALPYSASAVWQPLWYQRAAPHLGPDQVVLGFPFWDASADLLGVQAVQAMRYAVVAGTGPEWIPSRQGAEEPGYVVLDQVASTVAGPALAATATPAQARVVREALEGWGVTIVVLPMAKGPNTSHAGRAPRAIEVWLASVLGRPVVQDAAWVWPLARRSSSG